MQMAVETGNDKDTEEQALLTALTRVRENPAGSYVVHINLSALRESNRQSYFITIASRTFDDFLMENDARLFKLYNCDLVLLCRHLPVDSVDSIITKVRTLFSEDPLTQAETGSYEDRFASWHDLSQIDELQAYSETIKALSESATDHQEKTMAEVRSKEREANLGKPLAPDNLTAINQQMKRTQIADIINNQSVYRVIPGEKGEIVFSEYFVNMTELKARVAPGINLFSSPWLFQYLTETLDKRMLAIFGKRNIADMSEDISLNLNIATVMSKEFQQFNDSVGEHTKKIVIELQMIDIFSDMNAYRYACDFLHEGGYRVLVDGLNPLIIHYFDPSMLQSDFLKINWGPEFAGEENNDAIKEIRTVVQHAEKKRVILARVDSQAAIRWGASIGITRYQGYFIDKLVMAMRAQKGHAR